MTFEGIDGSGKSTNIEPLRQALTGRGHEVVVTREPGGTPLGEKLRAILINDPMDPLTEALLMFAVRKEHLTQVIEPALSRGAVVICDRFTDSSFAYQGGGKNVDWQTLAELESMVQTVKPDLTLWFDIDPAVAAQRRSQARQADKFESEEESFFERVRQGYARRAANSFGRIVRIDASKGQHEVWQDVRNTVLNAKFYKL
jgi:dTMP kinase